MSNIVSNLKKLLRGKKACVPGEYLKVPHFSNRGTPKKLKPGKGAALGQGAFGKVYRGSINNNGRRYVAYKEIDMSKNTKGMSEFEYKVAKKLNDFAVPDVYMFKKCEDMKVNILYMERLNGVSFNKWWQTKPTLEAIKSVIVQVVYNLYKIYEKYPGFRHNDLHGGNVVVSKDLKVPFSYKIGNKTYTIPNGGVNAVMIDFGLSQFPRMTNPETSDGGYEYVGISRSDQTHALYDLHFFLYTIFAKVRSPQDREERLIHNFIKNIIPDHEFLEYNGLYTTHGRLSPRDEKGIKPGVRQIGVEKWRTKVTENLPKLKDVLTHPFLTGEKRVQSIITKIPKAKTPKPKTKTPSPKRSTANKQNAIKRAAAILAAKPKALKRPGIAGGRPPVPPPKPKTVTPSPKSKSKTPVYKFINIKGKERVFKSKAWYEKALAKNRDLNKFVNSLSNGEREILKKKIC
jgi:predicted Ser/Thr protein kinase